MTRGTSSRPSPNYIVGASDRKLSPKFPTADEAKLRLSNARTERFARFCCVVILISFGLVFFDGASQAKTLLIAAALLGYIGATILNAIRNHPKGLE